MAGAGKFSWGNPPNLLLIRVESETAAHTLSFMVALLALYPDVQHKIHEEVRQLFVAEGSSFVRLFEDRLRFPVINSRLLAQSYKEHRHTLVRSRSLCLFYFKI